MIFLLLLFPAIIEINATEADNTATATVMFYNAENFFDCDDDSLKSDEEFLPRGLRAWTPARFWKKIENISRVLACVRDEGYPDIVGLAEVESKKCLDCLTRSSLLKNAGYYYIHYESDDARGIDVALLYNPYVFTVDRSNALKVYFSDASGRTSRDILHVSGRIYGLHKIDVFVCHFPSRLGGEVESEQRRCEVAEIIKNKTDSILVSDSQSAIIIMGDFNDTPQNKSIKKVLGAVSGDGLYDFVSDNKYVVKTQYGFNKSEIDDSSLVKENIINLMIPFIAKSTGTHKNQAEWGLLDQIMVSQSLFDCVSAVEIMNKDFQLMPDKRWLGVKPFRTYYGMKYQGGYSDHLPVITDLVFGRNKP
jgi:endonuclease/exonuclease/phosphatase family metal-dependent hydrolase